MRAKDENKAIVIREKAMEMIVSQGFDGLSMHKLAKSAGISVSTIYIYFKNREDLLNQLYAETAYNFVQTMLTGFSADMTFEEGLWQQWRNRFRHILQHPLHHRFWEQFRNSPLIEKQNDPCEQRFKQTMRDFVANAEKKKEIVKLPQEIFWAIAYGTFYTLVKFHLDNSTMAGLPFTLNDELLKLTFDRVMQSLRP